MANPITTTTWNPKTIEYIAQNNTILKSVAASMGISAEALAGAMAKENNPYQLNTTAEAAKDLYALRTIDGGFVGNTLWSIRYQTNWLIN